jgi:hypothetical protein
MNLVHHENGKWTPSTEEDKIMVRRQMNRLLETSRFRNSRRYPVLFRYIVEETLEGRGEFLKERLMGVHVFDRPVDYDTALDPIVRVTIAEIRKRIAQYYHEGTHDSEMRIDVLPGKYVPEFRLSKEAGSDHHQDQASDRLCISEDEQTAESAMVPAQSPPPIVSSVRLFRKPGFSGLFRYALGSLTVLLIVLAAGLSRKWIFPSALEELWDPLLASRRTVLFCLPVMSNSGKETAAAAGILVQSSASAANRINAPALPTSDAPSTSTFLAHETLGENIVFSDTLATLRISNYFAAHNRDSSFRPNTITTLNDLRQGPAVLVGGLDNQWTLRALAPLRYRFAGTHQEQYWIIDTKEPEVKVWGLDVKVPLSDIKRDYAIIARIHDESTGRVEMIVAGIGMTGTAAAGEFLVDPLQIAELHRRVGAGFRDRDFEAVLSTDVVDGIAGSARILTVAVW